MKSKVLKDKKGKLIFRNKHNFQVKKIAKTSLTYFKVAILMLIILNIK
jgi:hypothetical protein